MASSEKLLPDFTLDLLSIFVEADMKGRISQDIRESLELNEIFRLMAEENECLNGAAVFSTDYTEYACLSGRNVFRGQELYDDTWGEIVLMSGLPGTGKDTWIAGHLPEYPVYLWMKYVKNYIYCQQKIRELLCRKQRNWRKAI